MDKHKFIDIDTNDGQKAEYLAILNSDYFDRYPGDDLETAYEVLHGDGISNYLDDYPLTHEQAFRIKKILERKFDPQRVVRFIMRLRFVVEGAACLLDQPDYKTYKNDRKSMINILNKSSELLDAIREGRKNLYYCSNYALLCDDTIGVEATECQEIAVLIDGLLRIFIRKIQRFDEINEQNRKKEPGRPRADSKGIGLEIAKIWESCFDKQPTIYQEGLFWEMLEVVLEGLYRKPKDARRIIEHLKTKLK